MQFFIILIIIITMQLSQLINLIHFLETEKEKIKENN